VNVPIVVQQIILPLYVVQFIPANDWAGNPAIAAKARPAKSMAFIF